MYWLTMIKRFVLFCCLCLPVLAVSAQEQEVKFAFDNYHAITAKRASAPIVQNWRQ